MTVNYYEVLELPSDASEREIKKSYYRLARDLHPDKASNPDEARDFEERFARVSAAYNILKDKTKREDYDAKQKKTEGSNGSASPSGSNGSSNGTAANRVMTATRGVPGGPSNGSRNVSTRQDLGLTPEKMAIAQKAYARGQAMFKEGNFTKAVEFYEAAIQNNDTEPAYYSKLAVALIQAKKSAGRAVESAQKAIELDPYNVAHKLNLAFIFETIGSTSNAKRVYEDILKWDENNQQAKMALDYLVKGKKRPMGLGTKSKASSKGKAGGAEQFLQGLMSRFKR